MPDPEELRLQVYQRLLGELEAKELRHKRLLEGLRDPVVELKDGRINYLNPAWSEQLGHSLESSLNRELAEFIAPSDRHLIQHPPDGDLNETIGGELRLLTSDGREVWFDLRLRGQGEGRQLGILHNTDLRRRAEDMSRRHTERLAEANEQLQRAARLKDEFLAAMSHELRTPLNSVLGFAELLEQQVHGPLTEGHLKAARYISESGSHLLSLINDILDLSKVSAGQQQIHRETVTVGDLCESAISLVRNLADRKRQRLSLDNRCAGGTITADPRRLKQILVNLLNNAVKFTPEEGEINLTVNADSATSQMIFSVSDTGIGIARADVDRLFQPFTQLDSRLSRQHTGTGLGLALVKSMCELHGGSVGVTSTPGKGSTFVVRLPIGIDPNGPDGEDLENLTPVEARKDRPLVLVVEDDARNQHLVVSYLAAMGFETHVATNGPDALSAARTRQPHLILMDIQMPGMDGLEVTGRLKEDPKTARIPIIALTALAMRGDRERCLRAGADDYLTKPINLRKLFECIDSHLAQP